MIFHQFIFSYFIIFSTAMISNIFAENAEIKIPITYACEGKNSCSSPCKVDKNGNLIKDSHGKYKLNLLVMAPDAANKDLKNRVSDVESDAHFSDWCENVKVDKSGYVNPELMHSWNLDAFKENLTNDAAVVISWINQRNNIPVCTQDFNNYGCCNGKLYIKNAGDFFSEKDCCGDQIYDKSSGKVCCDGTLIKEGGSYSLTFHQEGVTYYVNKICCNNQSYNNALDWVCENHVWTYKPQ